MVTLGQEPDDAASPMSVPPGAGRPPRHFENGANVVFFGNNLSSDCQRCGAFSSTNLGHKYCPHVACPIAIKEFKRRRRKRTSTLEQVYLPRYAATKPDAAAAEEADAAASRPQASGENGPVT